jgi:hypothetical protein
MSGSGRLSATGAVTVSFLLAITCLQMIVRTRFTGKAEMRDIPALSWLNGKTHATSLGDNKGRPRHKQEQEQAVIDNQLLSKRR